MHKNGQKEIAGAHHNKAEYQPAQKGEGELHKVSVIKTEQEGARHNCKAVPVWLQAGKNDAPESKLLDQSGNNRDADRIQRNADGAVGKRRLCRESSVPRSFNQRSGAKSGMSVREMERMASHAQGRGESARSSRSGKGVVQELLGKDTFYKEMELALSEELHRRVKITQSEGKGRLEVEFFNKEELADLVARIAKTQW